MNNCNKTSFAEFKSYALVTGAAGGMGQYYAELLAARGYNLILVDINAEKMDQTVAAIRKQVESFDDGRKEFVSSFRIVPVIQDLSQMDAADKIYDIAEKEGCFVEILINNAGLFFFKEISYAPQRQLSLMMMVHTYTPLMLCHKFVPKMREKGRGRVLNISSLAAWMPWPGVGMYADTKRFVKAYSRSLRVECHGSGVTVTTAYFGAVDTPLYKLKPSLRKLARGLGIMITPQHAVEKALKSTFKGRRWLMPGFCNYIFMPFIVFMPDWLLVFLFGRVKKYVKYD